MANGVNLYELMHEFWKENDYEPFPASATALFFFLLDRANSRHWKMPIRCPTSQISHALMVSEQTVLNSRNVLYKEVSSHIQKVMEINLLLTTQS